MSQLSTSEIKELSSIERELSIVISSEAVNLEADKAYRRLGQRVTLKGFRQGKVPRHVLEQYYQADVERDILDRLLKSTYKEAVEKHALHPIAAPEIDSSETFAIGKPFTFKATVEVKPQISIKKWKGIKLSVPQYTVSDKQVDQVLEGLQRQHSTISPVTDRDVVEQGDLVSCEYSGTVNGTHEKTLSAMAQTITVGSGNFFPEVEQALVGHKIGETVTVDMIVPDNFKRENLRGKSAQIQIAIESIKTRVLPTLDDEFAKDIAEEYQTLSDLRAAILKSLQDQKEQREKFETFNAAVDALIEANPFEVPPSMVKNQAEYEAYTAIEKVAPKKAKEFFRAYGSELTKEKMPQATKTVQISLICEAIAAQENIEEKDDRNQKIIEMVIEHAQIAHIDQPIPTE